MPAPRFLRRLALAALYALAALAAPARADTLWRCWYQPDQHVACAIAQAAPARPLAAAERTLLMTAAPVTPPSRVDATSGLPPSVRLLRERPAATAGLLILIPLFTEPFDQASVAELVQAVMCGRQPACRTEYTLQATGSPEAAALLADAHDPVLTLRD